MNSSNFDVVVVGAGAAGLTAAIGLARSGFTVAAMEAAAFPGAENWSGCVYFCENLAHPDILGPEGVEALAWERRLVERGFFGTDGHGLLGMTYRDATAFRHCYTVLRPIYDHHLAQVALRHGVALLNETTVESLIREDNRVVGVCTNRGPLYADLVFLAEGDASHLVTREGYERVADRRETPKFLQGIKQVIDLPAGVIEETFGVGPEEGVAYELLLRNGSLRGRPVHLNMGGFVYTNRQSLSIGLVLPADHLHEHFEGDPNLLMEWFENLPALQPWLRQGRRGVFGAKIIRGGGAKDIPTLIDDGLAIGGAASAIGIDFPYPNFTGPATAMGLLLVQAARRIREENNNSAGGFTRDRLRRHYLIPLQRTHYWQDVEFLRRWPTYVHRTRVFFGRNLDLALGSAHVWTRPRRWLVTKWTNWLRLIHHVAGPGHWPEFRTDFHHLRRALRLREVIDRPALGRLLLDGTVNALRDLFGRPRANLPAAGTIRFHYSAGGGAEPTGLPPASLRSWFHRFGPVLASAARRMYGNDETPLQVKVPDATRLLLRQINVIDLLAIGGLTLAGLITSVFLVTWDWLLKVLQSGRRDRPTRGIYRRYAAAARQATDLTPVAGPAASHAEARLAQLSYHTVKTSHIHVLWPRVLPEKNAVAARGLWHVCPAHVYEARVSPLGQLQVVVNFENCIKCETCWRISDLVDWGRDGRHRFIYPVSSPAVPRLLEAVRAAGSARPALPRLLDRWEPVVQALAEGLQEDPGKGINGQDTDLVARLHQVLGKLETKLQEFDDALGGEPRTVDRGRAEFLEQLARYAQQLAIRFVEELRNSPLADTAHPGKAAAYQHLLGLANSLAARAEERSRRTWDQRYSWAAADGRHLRQHHITGLRRVLGVLEQHTSGPTLLADPSRAWLRVEDDREAVRDRLAEWSIRLDAVFTPLAWRDLERQVPLTSEQDAVLRDLIAAVPPLDPGNLKENLHPPLRKALLAELGRRDPSLAYRVACHLWARDLARVTSGSSALSGLAERWTRGDEWACFAPVEAVETSEGPAGPPRWNGEALFVPAREARTLLLLLQGRLVVVPARAPGLQIDPLPTLGLRGAGLARVRLQGLATPGTSVVVDSNRILRVWKILSAADLTSVASGMADQLCRRAIAHATSRVQFPGLFHDEEARDTIGKFGAVKKMIAEMGAARYLIETLDHNLSPTDFSSAALERTGLVKTLAAEALGTAPGSLSYNAGQVFGGTGYSEDDLLAKFYRDAAAWRFLGPANPEVYLRHGQELQRGWRADGQRLARVPEEGQLFEQVTQRKALQAELDEVRNIRSRLRSVVGGEGDRVSEPGSPGPRMTHPGGEVLGALVEGLARQDARLLASKALLLRTHARLEHGLPAETETALVRVWLEGTSVSVEEFEAQAHRQAEAAGRRDDRPVVELAAAPPVTSYADYLAATCPYESGDFLIMPVDLVKPRFVPEMVETDATLAARNREIRALLADYFGRPRGDGLSYERYIEQQHRPDAGDLDFCRHHGFFRMLIPKALGGEGRTKADYYLVTTNANRLADVALSLTIQVNTSIGTTPVLLARDKDLPRAQKDLGPFVGDPSLQGEVRRRLEQVVGLATYADPRRIDQAFQALHRRLEETVLARPVLRMLAFRFGEAWLKAGKAGQRFDLVAFQVHLKEALSAWNQACARAEELYTEVARRRDACDLFLRWVAGGQISAFALTEPSAGSDTARVATRATPRSVVVQKDLDGVLHFIPFGDKEVRYLLDAGRLEFHSQNAFYRWSEGVDPAPVCFDEYDYETDDPNRTRYYDHGSRRVHFTDIAQLRQRDGRLYYDYWELTGAKMWITNARMAGVMCLYAKTEEGITGFMVDRHAEGLTVGKDEAKMGQCGSPTNELSLQAVRVARENVIGLEGRGQVNALETLNVGRAGLATSAMSQLDDVVDRTRAFVLASHGEIPGWVEWRLQRMEEDRFIAEAVAYEVIGRFEHPQTKSARLESAIAKMLVSELLHRVIEVAEDIHGLAGQTQLHLVEKRKRDARILNIYEGTNEVQRFFILKDLAGEVAPRWAGAEALPPQHKGHEALQLEHLKRNARQRIDAALAMFGQGLWQNPNLQANCFLLSEVVAWLKAADSSLGRLAWLSRSALADDNADPSPKVEVGRRALALCFAEVQTRLRRFDEELTHLRRGYYAPEVRAASLLFDGHRDGVPSSAASPPASRIDRPLSILVVVEPSVAGFPHPKVEGGRLLEPHLPLSDPARSALEVALRLRDQATAPVTIEVVAVGPREAAPMLREVLSLGADRARLVVTEGDAVPPDHAAAALATVLGTGTHYDLILGNGESTGEEGLVARLVAATAGVPHAGTAARVTVQATEEEAILLLVSADGRQRRVRPLPSAVGIEPDLALRPFRTQDYLQGLTRTVEFHRWPKKIRTRPVTLGVEGKAPQAAVTEESSLPLSPEEAARRLLAQIGQAGTRFAQIPFEGALEDVTHPRLLDADPSSPGTVLAVLATDADGRVQPAAVYTLKAAASIAGFLGAVPKVLILAPQQEPLQRRALGQVGDWFKGDVVLLATTLVADSDELKCRVLQDCWPEFPAPPRAVVGEPWAEGAFTNLGTRAGKAGILALRVRHLVEEEGNIAVETSRNRGKLHAHQVLDWKPGTTCWITLGEGAAVDLPPAARIEEIKVQRWSPRQERFFSQNEIRQLLEELKQETGVTSLADADFILDVGFGVGNRDGYEAVIEPLERALRRLGVRNLVIGGSRKVTEELHLLPADRQIGQSGVSVNPQVLLAIGISGAPQHSNYIGPRATIIAFNRDPEAPLMTLNQRQLKPRVFPVVGDLFETVPALTMALQKEVPGQMEPRKEEADQLASK